MGQVKQDPRTEDGFRNVKAIDDLEKNIFRSLVGGEILNEERRETNSSNRKHF